MIILAQQNHSRIENIMPEQYIVIIEGNISSGKTTLLDYLEVKLPNAFIVQEPVSIWQNYKGHNLLVSIWEMWLFFSL